MYKPTKIAQVAHDLILGDKIQVGGGIRKSSKNYGRVLNVELLRVLQLAKQNSSANTI